MLISCDKCKTKYKVDDSVFKKPTLRVKCSKCQHVFTAYKTAQKQDDAPYVLEATAPACKIVCICNQKGGVAKTPRLRRLRASSKERPCHAI